MMRFWVLALLGGSFLPGVLTIIACVFYLRQMRTRLSVALLVGAAGQVVIGAFTYVSTPIVLRALGVDAFGYFNLFVETVSLGFALLFAVSLLMVFRDVLSSPRGRAARSSAAPSAVERPIVPA
jgi:hypothetical protein